MSESSQPREVITDRNSRLSVHSCITRSSAVADELYDSKTNVLYTVLSALYYWRHNRHTNAIYKVIPFNLFCGSCMNFRTYMNLVQTLQSLIIITSVLVAHRERHGVADNSLHRNRSFKTLNPLHTVYNSAPQSAMQCSSTTSLYPDNRSAASTAEWNAALRLRFNANSLALSCNSL